MPFSEARDAEKVWGLHAKPVCYLPLNSLQGEVDMTEAGPYGVPWDILGYSLPGGTLQ